MEAELEHELTVLIQQEEAAEEEGEERRDAASKQHEPLQDEHKDSHHDTSFNSSDMLFPSLLSAASPSTPSRRFHRTSPGAFLSPPVRQLPSPTQLHSLLLMTEGRLREREQQVQMAAEVGEALLRQQEEREEEARQWRERAEEAECEVERVRSEMERLQERNISLLTQVREAEAATDEQQRKTAEVEEQLAHLSAQLARERERRREDRQQLATSTSLATDNASLTATLASLHTQLHSYQQRIALLTQQYDTERSNTQQYRAEAEAWERIVDEREHKAKEREDQLLDEIESLSYRCRQLQEAGLAIGPAVGERGVAVFENGLEVEESVGSEVKELPEMREMGRNERLSTMPYESLLAELEGELQAEIAARQARDTVDETDKENVSSEANTVKEDETERMNAHETTTKLKPATETIPEPTMLAAVSATPAIEADGAVEAAPNVEAVVPSAAPASTTLQAATSPRESPDPALTITPRTVRISVGE